MSQAERQPSQILDTWIVQEIRGNNSQKEKGNLDEAADATTGQQTIACLFYWFKI